MEEIYLQDDRPWIIGLSGGKDSTAITQLAYEMLRDLPKHKRFKKIWVISSDTLVDTPIADKRRKDICTMINEQAEIDDLPIQAVIIRPQLGDSFWVNLIGRGYPSPNRWFRWCTDRLKIRPMNKFVTEKIKESGEVIILLGIRTAESQNRDRTIQKYNIAGTKLSQHNDIKGGLIYAPITDWADGEVWDYLINTPSPWGDDKEFLMKCYSKDEDDVQFIIDAKQDASGASRMGCWVCTVVPKDRSIMAYIEDGETWLLPLKELRDWLFVIRDDKQYREKWRKDEKKHKVYADILGHEYEGLVRFGHKVYGPFTLDTRHEIFRRVIALQTQSGNLKEKFEEFGVSLISPEEVEAIIRLWIYEGDDIEEIHTLLTECGAGERYIEHLLKMEAGVHAETFQTICTSHEVPPDLIDKLLIIEDDLSGLSRRHGIYNRLEDVIETEILKEMKESTERIT
ncbi:hypothetical protein AZH53_09785 [Methanomicrobiaceae archaeon CYW5]|nr:hypothetical protein [Methanovulcanius yangii]